MRGVGLGAEVCEERGSLEEIVGVWKSGVGMSEDVVEDVLDRDGCAVDGDKVHHADARCEKIGRLLVFGRCPEVGPEIK